MMKLTINGIEAELKADTTFKLVRENPYFSENSDYTFDVVLTLYQHCTLKDDISYLLPT